MKKPKNAKWSDKPPEIQNLYEIFSIYGVAAPLLGCPCCVSESEVEALHAQPLEKLDEQILDRFIWSATLTWGELSDFKHFLPRILELVYLGHFDLWILSLRLKSTQWRQWPADETEAIEQFLQFAWREAVQNNSGWLQDWLELWAEQELPNIEPILGWMNSKNPESRCAFAQWIASGKWQNEMPDVAKLFNAQFTDALEARFFENPEGPCAEHFAQAVDLVRSLAAWKQHEN